MMRQFALCSPEICRDPVVKNAATMIEDGRNIFRYDTYGDEAFWGTLSSFIRRSKGLSSAVLDPALALRRRWRWV